MSRFVHTRSVHFAVAAVLAVFLAYGLFTLPERAGFWGWSGCTFAAVFGWCAAAAVPAMFAVRGRLKLALGSAVPIVIGVRAALAMAVAGRIAPGDATLYLQLASNLAHGRGLQVFEPFMGVETRALFPPLYPAILAVWSLVAGLSTTSVSVLNLLIDLAAAGLLFLLGQKLGHRRAGVAAAWLHLMWPATLWSAPLAQKEGLCTLIVLALAVQWVGFVRAERPTARMAAGIGAAAGLLALTQPGELPLAALFGLVALTVGIRKLIRPSLVAMPVAVAAMMLPWWVRNAAVFHSFVPLTSAGGYGLWEGNNPEADGHWMPPPPELRGLPEIAFGRAAGRIGIDWIVAHPAQFARVTLAKLVRAWGIGEFGAMRFANMRPPADHRLSQAMFWLAEGAHLLLLTGAAQAVRLRRMPGADVLLLLIAACLLQTIFFGAFFEFGERHREFATPFLLLLMFLGLREAAPGHQSP